MKLCTAIARLWAASAVLGVLAFGFIGFAPWAPLDGSLSTWRTVVVACYFVGGVLIALSAFCDCYFFDVHKT